MTTTNSAEFQKLKNVPVEQVDVGLWGSRARRQHATIALAAQANGDDIRIARLPAGARPLGFEVNATATLGAVATISIGVAGDVARYKAAATFETPDTPTRYMKAAVASEQLADETEVLVTVGAAALPGAGTLVIDTYYTVD